MGRVGRPGNHDPIRCIDRLGRGRAFAPRDRRDLRALLADRPDQPGDEFDDDDRRDDAGLVVAQIARRRLARLQSLFAADAVQHRRRRRRSADRGEPYRRRQRRYRGRAAHRTSGAGQFAAAGAAGLGDPVERGADPARDRGTAGARGQRGPLRTRLAMGGGAAAADVLHPIDLRRARADRPGPRRQPDRGRLQCAGELRLDLRPFRRAGVGDIRVGPGDQPLASPHVFAAGRLFLPRSAHAVGRTVLAPLALSRGLVRATLAPGSADRRDDRGRDFRVLVFGAGDGPDRARTR